MPAPAPAGSARPKRWMRGARAAARTAERGVALQLVQQGIARAREVARNQQLRAHGPLMYDCGRSTEQRRRGRVSTRWTRQTQRYSRTVVRVHQQHAAFQGAAVARAQHRTPRRSARRRGFRHMHMQAFTPGRACLRCCASSSSRRSLRTRASSRSRASRATANCAAARQALQNRRKLRRGVCATHACARLHSRARALHRLHRPVGAAHGLRPRRHLLVLRARMRRVSRSRAALQCTWRPPRWHPTRLPQLLQQLALAAHRQAAHAARDAPRRGLRRVPRRR